MKIIIEGAEHLPHGLYGTYANLVGDTLVLSIDTTIDPDDCAYPVTVGTFV